ncbi:MAG: class I SAM-dependent methyltransferase [Phycisphaerales bacterium]|nr:class I SAM-dependent methyltransferase [Phycisphaerales bacterium]
MPPQRLWHGYAPTIEQVMAIGERNVTRMLDILQGAECRPRPGWSVLDFGCAAGFMTRHFRHLADHASGEAGGEVWGVDLSGPHIDWCMRHLAPPFRFALTSSFPSLPFEDGRFDLVYCGSVFSHIGEHCDGWLLELARVLRPGGTLYLTLVTKEAMWKYIERWPQLGFSKDIQRLFTPEQLRSDFATLVFRNGPGLHTVYDMDYFKAKCEGSFEVLRVQPDVYTFQWAVALRKRSRVARGAAPEVRTRPVGVIAPV